MAAVSREQVLEWLADVPDPEIPVVSIMDLGIVRDVQCNGHVVVSLAPTYSGCPATEAIEANVVAALQERGIIDVSIKRVLSPPWTTDWISAAGCEKLREYGIAARARCEQARFARCRTGSAVSALCIGAD